MRNFVLLAGTLIIALASCSQAPQPVLTQSGLDATRFRQKVDGAPTDLYVLRNQAGMEVCITNFGGRVVSIMAPDRDGKLRDVVLGFDNLNDYINIPSDFGASIGRYANRINKGHINIDGEDIQLPVNNFGHCLHGGPKGWQYQVYQAGQKDSCKLVLVRISPDGDEGFPGNVMAKVTYHLTEDNALDISYQAITDRKTIINMTHHSYFNLSGEPTQPITDHLLYVNAESFTPVDSTYMTTGEIVPVAGTPMDFTTPKAVGRDINTPGDEQLANASGYDHNWVLSTAGDDTQLAASLYSPESGIKVNVYTDEPGIQVYSGNFLDGTVKGKHGIAYPKHAAICLETQHFPDSPNHPEWPSVILEPGKPYKSHCIYHFTTE